MQKVCILKVTHKGAAPDRGQSLMSMITLFCVCEQDNVVMLADRTVAYINLDEAVSGQLHYPLIASMKAATFLPLRVRQCASG